MKKTVLAIVAFSILLFSIGCSQKDSASDKRADYEAKISDAESRIAEVKNLSNESDANKQKAIAIITANENIYKKLLNAPIN